MDNTVANAKYGVLPYELIVRKASDVFKTIWAIVIALGVLKNEMGRYYC